MKLQKWMKLEGATTDEISELLGISKSQAHKYQYGDAIPKPGMMKKIYVMTRGMVRSDDFNDLSEKIKTMSSKKTHLLILIKKCTPILFDIKG